MKKRIGIVNGGGDCPGLNTVIDAVVSCLERDYEIYGFFKSFEGVLNLDYTMLTSEITSKYRFVGGTLLKSVNKGNFPGKVGLGQHQKIKSDILEKTYQNYLDLGLECLIVLGGDGTLSVAAQLQAMGANVVGVPKSIDNDLLGIEFTFGFHTAVDIATEAMDRLATTAFSHDRVMILEVMGRNTGWIGLYTGLAGGADMILIPEIPFSYENIKKEIKHRIKESKTSTLIVIAEGAKPINGELTTTDIGSKTQEVNLGGVGEKLTTVLNQESEIEARYTCLGHIQRGGSPNSYDRILSRQLGQQAAHLARSGTFGCVATYNENKAGYISLDYSVSKLKYVPDNGEIVNLAKNLGISFGV